MKKNLLISVILSIAISISLYEFSYGQGEWEYGTSTTIGTTAKRVGIGTSTPQSTTKLDISTSLTASGYNYAAISYNTVNLGNITATINSRLGNCSNYNNYGTGYGIFGYIYNVTKIKATVGNTSYLAGGGFTLSLSNPEMNSAGKYQIAGCIAKLTGTVSGSYPADKVFAGLYAVDDIKNNLNTWAGYFDGNVCVLGTIRTTEVKIKVSPWADFVFDDNYKLSSLKELESYIRQNRHLPGIPKADEVKEEGINLGEMNATLLQKVEELTLYIIEQDKRITELEKKLNN